MTRADALIDARLTVQHWQRHGPYARYRVLWHVARALGVPPFLAGGRNGNCAAADLRGERGQRRLSAEIANPARKRGLTSGDAGEISKGVATARFPQIAAKRKRRLATGEVCLASGRFRTGLANPKEADFA